MKIILSRKGFDSSVGGAPSPVLEDGRLISLPIPSPQDSLDYGALKLSDGCSYAHLIAELGLQPRIDGLGAHADPDLLAATRPRRHGWKPNLGQVGAAAGHLRNQGVTAGDLFLFYGWFRQARRLGDRIRYHGDPGGFHAIFGFLRIGSVLPAGIDDRLPAWAADHPHALAARRAQPNNVLYVARRRRDAGVFCFRDALRLSKPGFSRSCWDLDPALFRNISISYHRDSAWRDDYFRSYPRAQEYVVEASPAIRDWAELMIAESEQWGR